MTKSQSARREPSQRRGGHAAAAPAAEVRLERWHRRAIYAALGLLAGSGALWLLFHYLVRAQTEWGERPHPLEIWWLRLHGLAAMLALLALGSLLLTHMRRAWRLGRNRASGAALGAILVLLIASGYALYYFAGEQSRPAISLIHWLLGIIVVALLAVHVVLGRAVTAKRRRTPQRRAPARGPAHHADEGRLHAEALPTGAVADRLLAGAVPGRSDH